MIIKLHNLTKDIEKFFELKELLEKNLFEVLIESPTIELHGRTINIGAFDQIAKRDPNNPYIIELQQKIIKDQIEQIDFCNLLLIYNDLHKSIDNTTFMNICICNYLKKPIYLINRLNKYDNIFYDIMLGMDIKYISDLKNENIFKSILDILVNMKVSTIVMELTQKEKEITKKPKKIKLL